MPLVSTVGTLRYNSFDFGPYTETVGMDIRPRFDSSGRTVVANDYTFTFKTVFTSDTNTNATVTAAIRALSKPGAAFVYSGRGLGDVAINLAARRDVDWGPKTETLAFVPRGKEKAARLTWRLKVTVPDCADAKYQFAFMEFCFAVDYAVEKGYTTRTIAGHLQIPQTRTGGAGGRTLSDTADLYRESIDLPFLEGFRRKYGPFKLNEAKTRLDFTITDEEMGPNIPPAGVVSCTASHDVGSSTPGLANWSGTLSAEYELEKGGDPNIALRAFFELARDRIGNTAAQVKKREMNDGKVKFESSAKSLLPVGFNMSEPDLYGRERRVKFSLSYTFVTHLTTIFGACSLFRPVPNSNYQRWAAAIQKTALSPRGYAGLVFDVKDDRLIDLCDARPSVLYGGRGQAPVFDTTGPKPGATQKREMSNKAAEVELRGAFPPPEADSAWVYYEAEFFYEVDNGVVPIVTLPTAALSTTTDMLGGVSDMVGRFWDATKGVLPAASESQNTGLKANPKAGDISTQRRTRPMPVVYFRGRAARAKYPVDVPRLVGIAGVPAIPANRKDMGEGFSSGVKFAAGETPIYTGHWNLRYVLGANPTKQLGVPPNPILGNPPGFG